MSKIGTQLSKLGKNGNFVAKLEGPHPPFFPKMHFEDPIDSTFLLFEILFKKSRGLNKILESFVKIRPILSFLDFGAVSRPILPRKCCYIFNKPRTAKVGAISKAQNCERGDPSGFVKLQLVAKNFLKIEGGTLWRHEKISEKFFNEIFEQCHSAEKCKRGDPLRFFDIHCVAKYRRKWRGTLWRNPKNFKKVA